MAETLHRSPSAERPVRFGQLLGRLVLAGLVAGALAGVFSVLVTERAIAPALEIEQARAAAGGQDHDPELFGRGTQLLGGFLGTLLAGAALAVVFAAVYGLVRHRLPGRTDFARVTLLAAIGFGVVALLPALKIPANPPAVGDPDTIGQRTTLYFLMVLLSVLLAVATVILGKRLAPRLGNWNATLAAGAFFLLAVGSAYAFLPSFNEVPKDFPATLLWQFRLAALAVQATLWTSFGLIFGLLAERVLAPRTAERPAVGRATPVPH
jgi:hypothetical protein